MAGAGIGLAASPKGTELPPAAPTMGCNVGGLELKLPAPDDEGQSELVQPPHATIVEALRHWCQLQPNKTLYTWLDDKGQEQLKWRYRELEQRANAVCHALVHQWSCTHGDRAGLMYLPAAGLEFIAAFWGCLFAGVIAVPVYPVDLRGSKFELEVERFGRIVDSCQPKLVLSHSEYLSVKRLHGLKNLFGSSSWPEGLEFEATDELAPRADCGCGHEPSADDLAFLQFTSGSTGDPKGVMLSHGNIGDNCEQMRLAYSFSHEQNSVAITWLPQYHDMGLIGKKINLLLLLIIIIIISPAVTTVP